MSYFNAKMRQIQFLLGLGPIPHWGSLQRSPGPLTGFKGPTSKGRGREGKGGETGGRGGGETGKKGEREGEGGERVEGVGREGRERSPWFLLTPPDMKSWIKPWYCD